jgi:hypothetical protein
MASLAPLPINPEKERRTMPYRAKSMIGNFIVLARWPVTIGLAGATILQFVAAFSPIIKPEQVNLPDLIPPLNTAILTLLWWRISQLEKTAKYFQERLDKIADHADERDDRENVPRASRTRR